MGFNKLDGNSKTSVSYATQNQKLWKYPTNINVYQNTEKQL